MHLVSASRRTDIPAFHAEWFLNRVGRGTAKVRSPFRSGHYDVSLDPRDVIAIVFWTKNAEPIVPRLPELESMGHCFTFLYTINNYPPLVEPQVPDVGHTLKVVRMMAERLPGRFMRWRYDTIVLTESLDRKWHLKNFERLCGLLAPYVRECIFSFCDYYGKTIRNMKARLPDFQRPDEAFCREMAEEMAEIASRWDLALLSCAHDFLLSERIGKARCIDSEFLARVVDGPERLTALKALKIAPTRKGCGCAQSRDIGAYDTCGHGCVYCYANARPELARRNLALIDRCGVSLDPGSIEALETP
jgi:hypothetical protein